MKESRRVFLGLALGMAAASAAGGEQMIMAAIPQETAPPYPLGIGGRRLPSQPDTRRDPKAELKANQDHIRKDVTRLSQLVGELQKGLQDDDTTKVLSMGVIRKTEEIEKLARQIRDLLRNW